MTIIKRNGRYYAKLKSGRDFIAGRTFDTQREAKAWLARERAALDGGVDPRAGRERMREALKRWLEIRRTTVAVKTHRADGDLMRLTPPSMLALHLSAISEREVSRVFVKLLADGLVESSVVRYRASLSSFFGWCVREKLILTNPVTSAKVPKGSEERAEMRPFTEDELWEVFEDCRAKNERLASIVLVLGWTGLRWGEARAMTVGDVVQLPTAGLMVRRSRSEGIDTKSTKGRRWRRVPVADGIVPHLEALADGKTERDPLFTTDAGGLLNRTAFIRTLKWEETGRGRRLHDLRHTAACLWLARGVDLGTVQAWMGHESASTTNRYLHFLGTGADRAGLERLNLGWGYQGGTNSRATGEQP